MADFTALKTAIQNAIKQNGNEEITGNLLQDVLLAIVTTLGDGSINDLVTALGSEATTRQQADGTLQQNIDAEATTRGQADTALGVRIDGVIESINSINAAIGNGYVYAGIATPSSTPTTGKVFYLALTAGTYTKFGATVVPQGINILKYNGSAWSLDSFLGLDDAPTQGSSNLVKSGGVLDSIIKDGSAFDLSAYNSGATYADLSAAITALNALPAAYKKGGMSFKFVLTSDNNYMQFRCIPDEFTIDVTKWAFCGDDKLIDNPEFVDVLLSKNEKVLEATDINGKKTFYGDCEVKGKFKAENIEYTGLDNTPTENSANPVTSEGIYSALSGKQDVLTFDNTPTLNSEKPVKSDGIAKTCGFNTSSPEYVNVLYDNNKRLLETTDSAGKKTIYGDCEIKGALEAEVPHKIQVILDMDYGGDCDDAYALRLAGYYHSIGKIDVKMISSCYKNTSRVMGMLAQAEYDGLGGIPVVAGNYEIETEPSDNYGANAAQIFPHSRVAPDGVGVSAFRKYLSQIKGKCTICTTGHLYNISDLINSEPDEWSPLNGNQLINEKVERFVVMGGRYDSDDYQYEFNFCDRAGSKEATLNFFANVSVPIYLCGFELCVDKYIGKAWNTNLDTNDKFRELEARFVEIWGSDITTIGREAPDPLTVMFMCNDLGKNIGMPVTRGVVSLNSNAYTKFTANNSGTHYLMSCIYDPTDYEWRMNTLLWRKSW